MKRCLLVVFSILSVFAVIVPFGSVLADENSCFVELVSQDVNKVVLKAHTGGSDGQLSWPNGGPITVNNEWQGEVDLDYNAIPRNVQVVTLSVPEKNCEKLTVYIHQWDPTPEPPKNGGSETPSVNYALMGHGVDDCRFFVGASAKYFVKTNQLVVTVQKMGEGARPFTVFVNSTDGKTPWSVQSDPNLSGTDGIGADVYKLPFDEVLNDKAVEQVYVSVYNAITHMSCSGPAAISIR